jgi:ribosomal protein L11 methyltransferase
MAWQSLELTVSAEHAETWSDALLECGASSVSIADAAAGTSEEKPLYGEPGMAVPPAWNLSVVAALFPPDADVAARLADGAAQIGVEFIPAHRLLQVADQDWVRLTQAQFTPIEVSRRLWIVPSWHLCPDPRAIAIILDPGLAFGTGSHPTTRLCLQWLDTAIRGGETVLDYGCGSGILTIAALKLGAQRALGVDIDRQAIIAATENAARNRVAAEFIDTSAPADIDADIVIANILANPLKLLAPILRAHCRVGGTVVLSGILETQAAEVIAAYCDNFTLAVAGRDEGWVMLAGERKC